MSLNRLPFTPFILFFSSRPLQANSLSLFSFLPFLLPRKRHRISARPSLPKIPRFYAIETNLAASISHHLEPYITLCDDPSSRLIRAGAGAIRGKNGAERRGKNGWRRKKGKKEGRKEGGRSRKKTLLTKKKKGRKKVENNEGRASRDEEYSRITPLGFKKMTYCAKGRH